MSHPAVRDREGRLAIEASAQKGLGTALFYGFVLLLAYLVYLIFRPFLVPLCWAAVLAVIFEPVKNHLERRLGKTSAAAISALCVTLILIAPAIGVAAACIHQGLEAAGSVQQAISSGNFAWVDRCWRWLALHMPGQTPASLAEIAHNGIERLASFLASQIGTILRHLAVFLFDLAVTILAMFYLFRDGGKMMMRLRQVLPFAQAAREEMIGRARDLIFASVTLSLVGAAAHGVFGGIAFAIVGISAPVFWGVVIGFFSLVPVVGDLVIWIPAMIGLVLRGHWGRAIFLAVVIAVVAGVIDNVLRPWFISGRARLSGLVVFIGVVGGLVVFGILGIILGPIVLATAISVLDLYTHSPASGNGS